MNHPSADTATFFDIHRHPHKHQTMQLDLAGFLAAATQGQLFATDTVTSEHPAMPAAGQALAIGADAWLDLVVLLVWSLTGKITDKETIYSYRDVFRALLRQYGLQNSFRLAVVCAYLLCAVRLKRNGWSAEDKNNIDDFRTWCEQLLNPDAASIAISTFMCAHREADEEDANKLVKKLKIESFVRVINVLRGIMYNLDGKHCNLTIYHLNHSKQSLLAIFPNIIFKYLEQEGLEPLLKTLGKHYDEIASLAAELSADSLAITLAPTEDHIVETRQLCEELGGKKWRTLTAFTGRQALAAVPFLHEVTEEVAMEEVARYMPEYGAVKADVTVALRAHDPKSRALITWYAEQEDLTPYAKALYETIFYYNWGRKIRTANGIAVGIDRDHSDFQVRAFHVGYNGVYEFGSHAPIVYLRRSEREIGKDDIHSLSLRQFWRYSGDNKR